MADRYIHDEDFNRSAGKGGNRQGPGCCRVAASEPMPSPIPVAKSPLGGFV